MLGNVLLRSKPEADDTSSARLILYDYAVPLIAMKRYRYQTAVPLGVDQTSFRMLCSANMITSIIILIIVSGTLNRAAIIDGGTVVMKQS